MSKSNDSKNSGFDNLTKDTNKINNDDKNNNFIAFVGPEQIVYEGSKVFLEGHSFPTNQKLVWKQIDGPLVDLKYESKDEEKAKIKNPYFKAPYIDLDFDTENINAKDNNNKNKVKSFAKLTFELISQDQSEKFSSPTSTVNIIVKMVQRALVFQGGGSLGAYELGVFSALCDHLIEKDQKVKERKNRPLFDVIAGSSIGGVNASIIVGMIKKRIEENSKNNPTSQEFASPWKDAAKQLDRFWNEISYSTWWMDNDFFNMWWNGWNQISKTIIQNYSFLSKKQGNIFGIKEGQGIISQFYFYSPENVSPVASAEAARRYFSWIHFLFAGVPNVMSPNFSQPDTKFFLGIPSFARFDNTPLTKTIKKYWDYEKYPLKTQFEKGEPRLLLVCVDVMDAASAVTFDSYLGKTKYTDGKSTTEDRKDNFNYVIEYPDGISIEHVSASMSPHLRYQYPKFTAYSEREKKDTERYFWDGAYLSNTPLRELIQAHRDYWYEEGNDEKKYVPHLEVYIANLYPTVEQGNELPADADTIEDREMDIRFHDRTQYDIKVAQLISDYIILYGQVRNLALKHLEKFGPNKSKEFIDDLENILNKKIAKSKKRGIPIHGKKNEKEIERKQDNSNDYDYEDNNDQTFSNRKYKDIIEGRFDIAKVVYINRKDDGNTVFGKAAEFSTKTINKLKEDGFRETLNEIENI
jgi:NTE family protein